MTVELERERIKQIYRDVERRCGVGPLEIDIVTTQEYNAKPNKCTCPNCKKDKEFGTGLLPNMGITKSRKTDKYTLVYTPHITQVFDTYMLAGTIAHELGHVASGHIGMERPLAVNEFEADAFARQHGFGDALSRVLQFAADVMGPAALVSHSTEHPPIMHRIWSLLDHRRAA